MAAPRRCESLVGVVRDEHEVGRGGLLTGRQGEAQVERSAPGPMRSGSVSAAVRILASRYASDWTILRVEPHRRVVHEDATVDLGEVDPPASTPSLERVEGADDVRPVEPEVEGEVVAGPRRDARRWGCRARLATDATRACDPSPPAMPMTSAPRRRRPRRGRAGRPRGRARSARCPAHGTASQLELLHLPPPAPGFMMSTGRCAGGAAALSGASDARAQREPAHRPTRGQEQRRDQDPEGCCSRPSPRRTAPDPRRGPEGREARRARAGTPRTRRHHEDGERHQADEQHLPRAGRRRHQVHDGRRRLR